MLKKMKTVEALPNYRLRITFVGGPTVELDFRKKIIAGTVTAPLLDIEFFQRVKIAQSGRAIEWPGEIDFCADSLWLEGSGEVNPFAREKAS